MQKKEINWKIISNNSGSDVVGVLLKNRGVTTKKEIDEFLHPLDPLRLKIKDLGIGRASLKKAIKRIKIAIKNKEEIIIYGDYDADGICSTAIIWETLYKFTKKVTPYIPDRFSEGYGINSESIKKLKLKNKDLSLIITVDNGIVAFDAIEKARELGIDVIVTDHHHKDDKLPKAYSIIHTDRISGSGVAWILVRELIKKLQNTNYKVQIERSLELAAIGTIADQLPLTSSNRSISKFGLDELARTERPGFRELFREALILESITSTKTVGTYEVNFLIAPRLNAMGRLKHAIDSLRLICTTDKKRAFELAEHIGEINRERQKIVDEVLKKARVEALKGSAKGAVVISGNFHEGVIGLAAGKLVEDFGRPAIVFSKGKIKSKASARSIPGFNIIDEIKKIDHLLIGCGGHPMAAGLSIETKNIPKFKKLFRKNSLKLLTDDLMAKTLKIDMKIEFKLINNDLMEIIEQLKPFGIGNPQPRFVTEKVKILELKTIGSTMKHLKLRLEKNGIKFEAIAFNLAEMAKELSNSSNIDVAYSVEENMWNGNRSLQLKIADIKIPR
jgi:single-stranded-DNA-specific exonuclease